MYMGFIKFFFLYIKRPSLVERPNCLWYVWLADVLSPFRTFRQWTFRQQTICCSTPPGVNTFNILSPLLTELHPLLTELEIIFILAFTFKLCPSFLTDPALFLTDPAPSFCTRQSGVFSSFSIKTVISVASRMIGHPLLSQLQG
jgi:hypothetical protein